MTTRNARKSLARGGFTLIEMMIVITIIAILASLLLVVLGPIIWKGGETNARSEIAKMEQAMGTARYELNNSDFLPSNLLLREDNRYWNTANGFWAAGAAPAGKYASTVAALYRAFGKNIDLQSQSGMDWNNNGTPDYGGDLVLEGHHCLVFWLGGLPSANGQQINAAPSVLPITCTGFSTNPKYPAPPFPVSNNPTSLYYQVQNGTMKGPFYPDFKTSRLKPDPSNGFLFYLDPLNDPNTPFPGPPNAWYATHSPPTAYPFSRPFAYFSYNTANATGYNVAGFGDCPSLASAGIPFLPYYELYNNLPRFMNPKGFQIICAGKDGMFGPGGQWVSTVGIVGTAPATNINYGLDNLTNFSRSPLKSPAN